MFSRWLVVVALVLTASANPDRAAVAGGTVTVGPTSEVKGQLEAELTINCGDGKSSGLVQYWHTPFGDLKRPGFVEPGPVLMRSDGTLVASNCSRRHSGLYYCLLQDARGTTLWPYQVHVHPGHRGLEEVQVASTRVIRSEDGISQQDLVAAVAAAVLLTFAVGFSAGALSRTYVLRCLGAIRTRIRSPRQQSDQSDRSGVTMTTLPPWYGHQEAEPVDCDETMETTVSSVTSSPPIKPQRSFRHKGDEEEEPRVYLEGCGHVKEEETTGYLEGCGHLEEEENQEEEGTYGGLYLLGGDEEEEKEGDEEEEEETQRRRQEEEKGDKNKEVEERRREEKETQRRKEEEEGDKEEEEERRREEKETERGKEKEEEGDEEVRREKETLRRQEEEKGDEEEEEVEERRREEKETQRRKEEEKGDEEGEEGKLDGFYLSGEDDEEETKSRQKEKEGGEEEEREEERKEEKETKSRRQEEEEEEEVQRPHSEASSEGGDTKPEAGTRRRRSRVIRLYQYDEEGQRYCHLPDPTPDEPGPTPRLRQRSVSLTRLNAIMAAASAGPLDSEGDAGRREETHFHMDI